MLAVTTVTIFTLNVFLLTYLFLNTDSKLQDLPKIVYIKTQIKIQNNMEINLPSECDLVACTVYTINSKS